MDHLLLNTICNHLSSDASVFEIIITELKGGTPEQRDKEIAECFTQIKSVFEQIFSKGIYRMSKSQECSSWLLNKQQLFEKMERLTKIYRASNAYDPTCFSEPSTLTA